MKKLVLSLAVLGLAAGSANAFCLLDDSYTTDCATSKDDNDGIKNAMKHCTHQDKKESCAARACAAGAGFLKDLSGVSVEMPEDEGKFKKGTLINAIDWINENGKGCATTTIEAAQAATPQGQVDAAHKAQADKY